MNPGDLAEYISGDEKYTENQKRRFYIVLMDETFDEALHVWWCIPLNLEYSKTWVRSRCMVKINSI
jgi:hypothetical protein